MTSSVKRIRWAELLLSAAALLLAIFLIWNCLDIYRIGTSPENLGADGVRLTDIYTRDDVSIRLSRMSWAFWLFLAALALAVVLRQVQPAAPERLSPSPEMQLAVLLSRRSMTPAMEAEEKKRRLYFALGCGVSVACAVPVLLYLLNPNTFASADLETVMGVMVIHTLPFLLVAFAALMILAQLRHGSILREIAAAKAAEAHAPQPVDEKKAPWKPYLRIALYLLAVGFIVAGISNGGMFDVLVKAINICTECIGLG